MRQTCSNTVGPSPARCSLYRMARGLTLRQSGEPPLAFDQRQVAQVVAVMLDQVEGEQHRLVDMASPSADEVEHPVVAHNNRRAVD